MRSVVGVGFAALLALVTAWALPAAGGAPSDPPSVFLHVFPVTDDRTLRADQVELGLGSDGDQFGELTARSGVLVRASKLRLRLAGYPPSADPIGTEHRACSFLIDCDEPSVRELAERAGGVRTGRTGVPKLQGWVRRYIQAKRHRSFDIASTVARRREGDCTEHAVLLTALARLHGHAARVVLGLVLVRIEGQPPRAFGHAWVERHDGKAWRPADAALPLGELKKLAGPRRVRVSYLPIRVVKREDAGFASDLIEGAHLLHVRSIALSSRAALQASRARSKVRR